MAETAMSTRDASIATQAIDERAFPFVVMVISIYRGTNSIVVSRRRALLKPRTNFLDPGVAYFCA